MMRGALTATLLSIGCTAGAPDDTAIPESETEATTSDLERYARFLVDRGPYLQCNDRPPSEQPGATVAFGTVAGTDIRIVRIADPAGPCLYRVGLVVPPDQPDAGLHVVPLPAATYLNVAGARIDGSLYLAISTVHVRYGDRNGRGNLDSTLVEGYRIDVMQRDLATGAFGPPKTLVTHPTSAVWLDRVTESGGVPHVRYVVDSLHERLFVTDARVRAADDGFYERSFTFDGADGRFAPGPARRTGGYDTSDVTEELVGMVR